MIKLRHNRPEWVYQRRQQLEREAIHNASDDGMSHGMIPFGAITQWQSIEGQRLAAALARPVPARITGWDATGIGLVVTCPYCRAEHRHIVSEDGWQPDEPLDALCSQGHYRIAITQAITSTLNGVR